MASKILLGKAGKLRAEKNWEFTRVSQGKTLMRKARNSQVVHMASKDDLVNVA